MQDALCDKYWMAMTSLIGFAVVFIVCQGRCKVINSGTNDWWIRMHL